MLKSSRPWRTSKSVGSNITSCGLVLLADFAFMTIPSQSKCSAALKQGLITGDKPCSPFVGLFRLLSAASRNVCLTFALVPSRSISFHFLSWSLRRNLPPEVWMDSTMALKNVFFSSGVDKAMYFSRLELTTERKHLFPLWRMLVFSLPPRMSKRVGFMTDSWLFLDSVHSSAPFRSLPVCDRCSKMISKASDAPCCVSVVSLHQSRTQFFLSACWV